MIGKLNKIDGSWFVVNETENLPLYNEFDGMINGMEVEFDKVDEFTPNFILNNVYKDIALFEGVIMAMVKIR